MPRSPGPGRGRLALLALAVAHLLPPVDLVPEVLVPEVLLGLLGRTDDALVALRPGGAVRCETGRYLGRERTQPTVIDQPPTRWRRSPARPPATWYTSQRERASAGGPSAQRSAERATGRGGGAGVSETMRAVTQKVVGGPEVLQIASAPVPEPLPTEIRVRVAAAGVNPVDWKTRAGSGMAPVLGAPPFTVGWDVAGTVDAVGPGVTRFAVGDTVFGMPWFPRQAAAYAEFVTAPSRHFAHRPSRLDAVHAAALPLAGLTAWQCLVDIAAVQPGQRVLVHAAAGGVGHLAVQIAKSRGAHVIGTASSGKHDLLHDLGIDEAIDYRREVFEQVVEPVDLVCDLLGGDVALRSLDVLRPDGLMITLPSSTAAAALTAARERGLRATGMLVEPDGDALDDLARLVEQRHLRVIVAETFPLERAAHAHRAGELGRTTGKLVLTT